MTKDSKQRTVLWIIEDNESAIINMLVPLSRYFPDIVISDSLQKSKTLDAKLKNHEQINVLNPYDSARALSGMDFDHLIVLLDRNISNEQNGLGLLYFICSQIDPKAYPVSVHIIWNSFSDIEEDEVEFLTNSHKTISRISSNQASVSLVQHDGKVFHLNKFSWSEKDKMNVLAEQGLLPNKPAIPSMQDKGLLLDSDKLIKRPVKNESKKELSKKGNGLTR
jgi:hypothetical protein